MGGLKAAMLLCDTSNMMMMMMTMMMMSQFGDEIPLEMFLHFKRIFFIVR